MKKSVAALVILFLLAAHPSSVVAQVYNTQSQAETIQALKKSYTSDTAHYRDSLSQFSRANTEHLQLQTLRSYDAALDELQNVYTTRAQLLATYAQFLHAQLLESTGVPLELKQPTIIQLEAVSKEMLNHKTQASESFTKVELDESARAYVELEAVATSAFYKTQILIMLGKLQAAHDYAQSIYAELTSLDALEDQSISRDKKRAQTEVEEQLESVSLSLESSWSSLIEIQAERNFFNQSLYRTAVGQATQSHASLSRMHEFLEELNTL